MTISTQDSKVNYQGNGQTTVFQIPFPFLENNQIYVQKKDAQGNLINYTYATDYTVTGAGEENGGSVTLNVAPEQGSTISIYRDVPLTQEVDYRENEIFPAETHEEALDKLTMEVQQIQEQLDRSVKVDRFSDVDLDNVINEIERVYDSTDNIDIVANSINDVNTVGGNIANVNTVAGDIDSVATTATNINDVKTVAQNKASLNITAANITDVKTVSSIKDNIQTVADNNTNITTVATNISDVNTAATNIEAIKDAPTAATNAANSATASANSATSASASAQAAQDAADKVQGLLAIPIGTIFQSVYVDESLDIARQLNGQLISSTKFTGFRSWLNTVQTAIPNLFTTETNWQSEKALSKFGQVGKFVIDDTAQTIRLPAVVNPQGLLSLSGIGNLVNESLPNITGSTTAALATTTAATPVGAIYASSSSGNPLVGGGTSYGSLAWNFDASRSSSTYQDNAPVQQEAVQYPYYIQVATGVEETLPAIREYKINTPFFFGQSMYSDVAPDNASWLASNGQYNAKTVYPDYYDWLVEQMNAGVKGFKGNIGYAWKSQTADLRFWTAIRNPSVGCAVYGGVGIPFAGNVTAINPDGTLNFYEDSTGITYENLVYTESENINNEGTAFGNLKFANDYDFVVNQTEQTFRLPLKNGQEGVFADGVKGNGLTIGLTNGTKNVGLAGTLSNNPNAFGGTTEIYYGTDAGTSISVDWSNSGQSKSLGLTTDPSKSGMIVDKTVPSGWNLYYYVGDTVQDASLINAGAVLGQLSTKADIDASNFNADGKSLLSGLGMPSNKYIDLTPGASGSTYTAPANGWFSAMNGNGKNGFCCLLNSTKKIGNSNPAAQGITDGISCVPVVAGDTVVLKYSNTFNEINQGWFRFIYAQGNQ